jgi:hypothetical protein
VKNVEDLEARQRSFQAAGFQVGGIVGHVVRRFIEYC